MKKLVILIVLIAFTFLINGKTVVPLPEISDPTYLAVGKNMVYIVEHAVVRGYSLEDFKKVLEFGTEGEGPGEFKLSRNKKGLILYPMEDRVYVNSVGKISFWSKKGKLLKETALKRGSSFGKYLPYGDSFIGMVVSGNSRRDGLSFDLNIYDKNFEKLNTIINLDVVKKGRLEFPITRPTFSVWENQVFVPDQKEFKICIYNLKTKNTSSINSDYIPELVSNDYKKRIHEFLKTSPMTRSRYETYKKMVTFPKYFPPIQSMWVDSDKVYVLTFKKRGVEDKFIIFSVTGEVLGESYKKVFYEDITRVFPMTIKNGYIYQINENQETEEWELQIDEIQ